MSRKPDCHGRGNFNAPDLSTSMEEKGKLKTKTFYKRPKQKGLRDCVMYLHLWKAISWLDMAWTSQTERDCSGRRTRDDWPHCRRKWQWSPSNRTLWMAWNLREYGSLRFSYSICECTVFGVSGVSGYVSSLLVLKCWSIKSFQFHGLYNFPLLALISQSSGC